jgi:type I restriction enzyme R subunit
MSYTEATLIEQPTINLFAELGWQTLDCYSETFGDDSLLGRDNRSEIVLVRELREALTQIKDYQK